MKLYYTKGACSLVVRIVINELGLDSEFESVNLTNKKTETGQDFLLINPKGSVPVLKLNNDEILTENAVILQYLADEYKATHLLPKLGDFKRYRVLEWVNYITTELHKGFSPLFNPSISQALKEEIFIPLLKAKFTYINTHLEHHTFLLGDQFTLPDAYLFVMTRWMSYFNMDMNRLDHLTRYCVELGNRPSIQQSLQQEQ